MDDKKIQSRQSGNIFLTLFAGVAMVGVLGAATMNFVQGPLKSSVQITRQNSAETQMTVGAQVAVMAAATSANNGDCDADGMIEPLEYLSPGAAPAPAGGGLVPMNIGISKTDPWGTAYGYCVWDYGSVSLQTACQTTSGTNKRLQGSTNPAYPVVALVSAGADKKFTTTCRNFSTGADRADKNGNGVLTDSGDLPLIGKASATDDDIIFSYTYQEAMAASGGLWTLKAGDPGKAVITKDLEVSGGATFSGTGTFERLAATGSDYLEMVSGLKLGNASVVSLCNPANNGVLRLNSSGSGLEICDGAKPGWTALGAGGGPEEDAGEEEGVGTPADCTGLGPKFYNDPISGHCYYASSTEASWDAAQAYCGAQGGYLATISSAVEQDSIQAKLGLGNDTYLIGGNDSAVEGEWRWAGGEVKDIQFWSGSSGGTAPGGAYTNWNSGHPAVSTAANCLMARKATSSMNWQSISCASTEMYICEKSSVKQSSGSGAKRDLDMAGYKVINSALPTANSDLTSKEYVDTVVAAAAGGGKRIEIVTTSANAFPACPAAYTATGCVRSGASKGNTTNDDVVSGIFVRPSGVAAKDAFVSGGLVIQPYFLPRPRLRQAAALIAIIFTIS